MKLNMYFFLIFRTVSNHTMSFPTSDLGHATSAASTAFPSHPRSLQGGGGREEENQIEPPNVEEGASSSCDGGGETSTEEDEDEEAASEDGEAGGQIYRRRQRNKKRLVKAKKRRRAKSRSGYNWNSKRRRIGVRNLPYFQLNWNKKNLNEIFIQHS